MANTHPETPSLATLLRRIAVTLGVPVDDLPAPSEPVGVSAKWDAPLDLTDNIAPAELKRVAKEVETLRDPWPTLDLPSADTQEYHTLFDQMLGVVYQAATGDNYAMVNAKDLIDSLRKARERG